MNFEYIDPNIITEKFYDFELDWKYAVFIQTYQPSEFYNINLVDLNFETYNPIMNSGGLFLLIVLLGIFMLLTLAL